MSTDPVTSPSTRFTAATVLDRLDALDRRDATARGASIDTACQPYE